MRGPTDLTSDELKALKDATDIAELNNSPGYAKIRLLLTMAVDAALEAVEKNNEPRLDTHYLNVWRERKFIVTCIENYIHGVREQKQGVVRGVLEALGIPNEKIEKNLDMDILPILEAHNNVNR